MKKKTAEEPEKNSVSPSKLNDKGIKALIRAAAALNTSYVPRHRPKGRL